MKYIKNTVIVLMILFASVSAGKILGDYIYSSAPTETKQYVTEKESKILVFTTTYTKCNHTETFSDNQKVEFSSKEELISWFPSWEIVGGDEDHIIFNRKVDSYCNQHYVAKLKENTISITSLDTNIVVYEFKVNLEGISEEEKQKLQNGINIDSKQDLTSFIEDFTS